jgi:hypothetical protein
MLFEEYDSTSLIASCIFLSSSHLIFRDDILSSKVFERALTLVIIVSNVSLMISYFYSASCFTCEQSYIRALEVLKKWLVPVVALLDSKNCAASFLGWGDSATGAIFLLI